MIKCWQCNEELLFIPVNKTEIVLKCSNASCGFKTIPIKIDPNFTPTKVIKIPQSTTIEKGKEESSDLMSKNVEEIDKKIPEVILTRKGEISGFSIYCLDFSNTMEKEIIIDEETLELWKNIIQKDDVLPKSIKERLIQLITPPTSRFRAMLFSFSLLILENLKKMTVGDFQSFQIISIAGISEEIFRFPNFSKQTAPNLILDFINTMEIRRKDYKSSDLLKYRDYQEFVGCASELLIEIRDRYSNEEIKVFHVISGGHVSQDDKKIILLREIKNKFADLEPFSINFILLDPRIDKRIYLQVTQRFSGEFSFEPTFKGIINAILYQKYNTDMKKPDFTTISRAPRKEPKEGLFKEKPKELDNILILKSQNKIDNWENNIEEFNIEYEADQMLNIMKKKVEDDLE